MICKLVFIFRLFDLDWNVIILFSIELFDHDGNLGRWSITDGFEIWLLFTWSFAEW